MKTGFTVRQHFDSTNHTTIQEPTIFEAVERVKTWMQSHPEASYSIYRNSTNRLVLQFEDGKETINRDAHAVALGRKGGAATKGITSEAKKAASRANVAKARIAKAEKKK